MLRRYLYQPKGKITKTYLNLIDATIKQAALYSCESLGDQL